MVSNTTIQQQKSKTIEFYDYFYHLEKFGFEWNHNRPRLRQSVKLSADQKKQKNVYEKR